MAKPLQYRNIAGTLIPYSAEAGEYSRSLEENQVVSMRVVETEVGSLNMLRTWRMWMREIAIYMQHNKSTVPLYYDVDGNPHGSRPFDERDAHLYFTNRLLGTDENGQVYSWSLDGDGDGTVAPKSKRLFAMDQLVIWTGKEMIPITIPRRGDYAYYREAQEQ